MKSNISFEQTGTMPDIVDDNDGLGLVVEVLSVRKLRYFSTAFEIII
ncbi:UNVERIFIED_ORG: hypothetical protein ABRZ91_003127 [Heyndrickxia coagulans]